MVRKMSARRKDSYGRLSLPECSGKHWKGGIPRELKRGTFPGMNVTNQGDTEMGEHIVDSFMSSP